MGKRAPTQNRADASKTNKRLGTGSNGSSIPTELVVKLERQDGPDLAVSSTVKKAARINRRWFASIEGLISHSRFRTRRGSCSIIGSIASVSRGTNAPGRSKGHLSPTVASLIISCRKVGRLFNWDSANEKIDSDDGRMNLLAKSVATEFALPVSEVFSETIMASSLHPAKSLIVSLCLAGQDARHI